MKYLSSIAFVAILLLVSLSSCNKVNDLFGKNKKKAIAEQQALQAKQDSIRVADSLRKAQEEQLALELARQESIRLAEEEAARQASKYHMIVGSFYTPEYARNWAETFRQRGHNVQILQMKGSRFELVSAESFSTLRAAYNKLYDYQESIMPDAWVYIND